MHASPRENRFVGLDGLRGVAAIAVLGQHTPDTALGHVLSGGYLAVDLFFLLSGFVLAHTYERRLATDLGVQAFMRLRLVRLYPLYLLGSALAIAILVMQTPVSDLANTEFAASVAAALLMLPCPAIFSLDADWVFPLNYPAWSLFLELAVNVVFALIAAYLTRRVLIAVLSFGLVLIAISLVTYHSFDVGYSASTFFGGFGRVTFSFFCGVALFRLWSTGLLDRFKPPAWLPVALLMCVFAVALDGWMRPAFDVLAATILFPIVVIASVNAAPRGLLASAFSLLGLMSYGFYVLQVPVMSATGLYPSIFGHEGTIAVIVIVLAAAAVAHVGYDVPLRRWINGRRAAVGVTPREPLSAPLPTLGD